MWSLIIATLISIGWMANATFAKLQKQKERNEKVSILPELKLLTLDSLAFDVRALPAKPIVLIYFNSGCEHCQYEASVINDSAEKFNNAELIFFSAEKITAIRQFASKYGLNEHLNIHFTKINFSDVADILGILAVPHIFIYGPDRKLRKEFKGETRPQAILKYLY
jgi:thiol-disulfide isomerase/thioredoxin